jgi:hypothetical protein
MCSDAPPAPLPDPKIGQAAERQAAIGEEYLAFTKEQFAVSTAMQKDLQETSKQVSDYFLNAAKEDRDRYETVFKPIEDEFIKLANEFDSPAKQAEAAGRARTDVMQAAEIERGAQERRMQSVGIRPDSGKYEGIQRAVGLGTVATSVDAQNRAKTDLRDKAIALKGAAIDMGKGLPASAGANMGAGLSATGVPISTHQQSTGIMQPGVSGAMAGQKGMGEGYNNLYKGAMSAWESQNKLDAANAAGIGNFAGMVLGAGLSEGSSDSIIGKGASALGGAAMKALPMMFLSSKKAKENRKPVKEGEALDAVKKMPVDEYDYKPGQGDGGHHVGPMAEDFARETGKGDGRGIAVQDAIGVTMGAIKDLSAKVDRIAKAVGIGPAPVKA